MFFINLANFTTPNNQFEHIIFHNDLILFSKNKEVHYKLIAKKDKINHIFSVENNLTKISSL